MRIKQMLRIRTKTRKDFLQELGGLNHSYSSSGPRNFTPTGRRNPCANCGDSKGNCREVSNNPDLILCMKAYSQADILNSTWKFSGFDSSGLWGKVFINGNKSFSEQEMQAWKKEREQRIADEIEAERTRIKNLAGREDRDEFWRNYAKTHPLTNRDKEIVRARGLSDETIEKLCFYSNNGGIGCLMFSLDGLAQGSQYRLNIGYRWNNLMPIALKETGQNPVTVLNPQRNPRAILSCEGTVYKAAILAQRNPDCLVIGIGGLQAVSSSREIQLILKCFHGIPFHFMPDGGSLKDPMVMLRMAGLYHVCTQVGVTPGFGWWGQHEKGGTDVDEIPVDTEIEVLSFQELKLKGDVISEVTLLVSGFLKRSVAKFTQGKSVEDDSNILAIERNIDGCYQVYDESEYWGEELVTIRNVGEYEELINKGIALGKKIFLDLSQAGMGKSTAAALIREISGIDRIIHLSNRSRNLTTEEANNSYVLVPARAEKLYRLVGRQTLSGKNDVVTAKPAEGVNYEELKGNCHYAKKFQALQNSGWDMEAQQAKLCGICPFAIDCMKGEGDGYGYLYQMEQTMRQKRLVASLAFMYRLQNEDLSNTMLVFDDENPIVSKSMFVTVDRIQETMTKLINSGDIQILTEVVPLLARIVEYIQTPSRYGFSHVEMFKDVELSNIAELEKKAIEICTPDFEKLRIKGSSQDSFKEKMEGHGAKYSDCWTPEDITPNFVSALLQIMGGTINGGTRVIGETFEVMIKDPTWEKTQEKAAAVLILDATANKKILALKLGCNKEDIFTVSQPVVNCSNQKTIHVLGAADFSRSREVDRMPAFVAAMKSKYNTDSVAVLDYKGLGVTDEDFTRGTLFSDNRGTNKFKGADILIQAGLQVPCRGALALEFSVMTGIHVDPSHKCENAEFLELVKHKAEAEEIQSQNRQRAYRFPDRKFVRIVVSNREDICSDALRTACPGLTIEKMRMIDLCPEAAKKGERTMHKILAAITSISGANVKDIAVTCDLSESTISHALSQFGGFRKTCEILYILLSRKTQVSTQDLEEFLSTNSSLVEYTNQVLDDDLSTPTELATELDKLLCPLTTTQLNLLVTSLSPVQAQTATELILLHALSNNSAILSNMKLSETGDSIEDLVEGLDYIVKYADVAGLEALRGKFSDDKESMQLAASKLPEAARRLLTEMVITSNKAKEYRAT